MECQKCGEQGAVNVDNIDDYEYLCSACLHDYVEEIEALETIIKKQEEEADGVQNHS